MGYYEIERCPYCRAVLERRIGAGSRTPIGPEFEQCLACRGAIRTYRTEWIDFSGPDRVDYYLRVAWWVLGGVVLYGAGASLLLVGVLAGLEIIQPRHGWPLGVTCFLLFSTLVAWLTIRVARAEIKDSLRRKPDREASPWRHQPDSAQLMSMEDRVIHALRRTWEATGNRGIVYSRQEVVDLVRGLDRMERYGEDQKASAMFRQCSPEMKTEIANRAFVEEEYMLE